MSVRIARENLVLSMPRRLGTVNSASQADLNAYEKKQYLSGILSFHRRIAQVPEIYRSMA